MTDKGLSASCPYLGRDDDPDTVFLQAEPSHRCYATWPPGRPGTGYQGDFCLGESAACAWFLPLVDGRRAPPAPLDPEAAALEEAGRLDQTAGAGPPSQGAAPNSGWLTQVRRLSFEEQAVYAITACLVLAIGYFALIAPSAGRTEVPVTGMAVLVGTASPSTGLVKASAVATRPPMAGAGAGTDAVATTTATTAGASVTVAPPPAATLVPPTAPVGGLVAALSPSERGVASFNPRDRVPTYGQRSLNVGRFGGRDYLGGLLFSLSRIPAGSRITGVQLELAGLSDSQRGAAGEWTVDLLEPEPARKWADLTYETLAGAPVSQLEGPWTLAAPDLAPRRVNVLKFSSDAVDAIAQRLKEGRIAFRLRGPTGTSDNLFSWDSGYGEGFGTRPVLRVAFVPPPPTPGPNPGEPTALPLIIWVSEPTPAATATPLPGNMPRLLDRMILFLSDRFGHSNLMVYDVERNRFGQVTQPWVYVVGEARDVKVGDTQVRVRDVPCGGAPVSADENSMPGQPTEAPDTPRRCAQLEAKVLGADWREITQAGYLHYDPALSPDGQWIAYVSTITGNDEVFKIRVDGSENTRLTENEWAWDKHPSWSPDGGRIVFWSNRDGRKQIYVMNADGSDAHNISNSRFNDWNPVWVK